MKRRSFATVHSISDVPAAWGNENICGRAIERTVILCERDSCCGRKEDGQNNRRPLPLRRIGARTIRAVIRAYMSEKKEDGSDGGAVAITGFVGCLNFGSALQNF